MNPTLQAAIAAREAGRYAEALGLLNALLAERSDAAAWLERGRVYLAINDQRKARHDFNAASYEDPSGAVGDEARGELLRSMAAPANTQRVPAPRPRPTARRQPPPNPWARTLVMVLLLLSILCALVAVIGFGQNPLQFTTTAAPTRTISQ
jgi:ferric-dicitrate binding protein FerR (iron transport regulator)